MPDGAALVGEHTLDFFGSRLAYKLSETSAVLELKGRVYLSPTSDIACTFFLGGLDALVCDDDTVFGV